MRHPFVVALLGVSILPAACDTKPTAGFEENYQAAQERTQGDRFRQIGYLRGTLTNYLQSEPEARESYLASYSASAAGAVTSALGVLAGMDIGEHGAVAGRCKAAIDAALAFRTAEIETGLEAEARRRIKGLEDCRLAASEAEKSADGETRDALEGWRRTASAAMLVLGITTTEKGDKDQGVEIWREADKAVTADQPGHKFQPGDLRYSMRYY